MNSKVSETVAGLIAISSDTLVSKVVFVYAYDAELSEYLVNVGTSEIQNDELRNTYPELFDNSNTTDYLSAFGKKVRENLIAFGSFWKVFPAVSALLTELYSFYGHEDHNELSVVAHLDWIAYDAFLLLSLDEGKHFGGIYDTCVALSRKGILDAGDIPSPSAKSKLYELGYASPAVQNGEEGYTVLTYDGLKLMEIMKAMSDKWVEVFVPLLAPAQ